MKILVVDDEQDLCDILQFNLENEGYEVDTVNSAEEALCLPLSDYALILLDVMMGEMSGFQMARRLKDDASTASIPIIFITALDSEDNTVRGLNIGADDYIAKPLSMKEVKARVKAVLRRTAGEQRRRKSGDGHQQRQVAEKRAFVHLAFGGGGSRPFWRRSRTTAFTSVSKSPRRIHSRKFFSRKSMSRIFEPFFLPKLT